MAAASFIFAAGTIMRVGALQDWPELSKHEAYAAATRLVEVGIFQDDVRRLAAEFLVTRLTVSAARLATSMPARVEPVKRDHVDAGVLAHRDADVGADAVHEVEHARRHARFMQDFGEDQRARSA